MVFNPLLGFGKNYFVANKEDKPGSFAASFLLFKKICDPASKSNNFPCGPGKLHKLNFSQFDV